VKAAGVQIFLGNDGLRWEQHPIPSLSAGEVLVEIDLATICGSDLHTLEGRRPVTTPVILGHEAVGRVVELGPAKDGKKEGGLNHGDRVSWSIADSCGDCRFCGDYGLPEKCDHLFKYGHAPLGDGSGLNGCYSTHILLRSGTHIVKIADHLSDALVAPINCALATVVNAIDQLPQIGRSVVVQGAGLLGLYACAALRDRGFDQVFCVDVEPARLALVPRFGAIPIDGTGADDDVAVQIEKEFPQGVDAVIEVAGDPQLVPTGVRLLRPGGHYVFVGMVHPQSALEITGEQIVRKCLTLRGVHNYAPRHLDQAVAFLERSYERYPYEELVSQPLPLERLDDALELARSRRFPRVAVCPRI
jgi:putative phosphonate catabolism associated alcohol dehydrogenase